MTERLRSRQVANPFDDPRGLPLSILIARLSDELFPRLLAHAVRVAFRSGKAKSETALHIRHPKQTLRMMRGLRSDRALVQWLHSQSLKNLCAVYLAVIYFQNAMNAAPIDSLGYQRGRELLGKRSTKLSLVRAALRFHSEMGGPAITDRFVPVVVNQ